MSEHSAQHAEQAKVSIAIIKWLAIIALFFLPFSFSDGIADSRYLAVALAAGSLWVGVSVYSWRHGSPLAGGIAFLIVIGAYHLSSSAYSSEPPFGHFLQWITALLVVAGFPTIAFGSRLIRYCALQKEGVYEAGDCDT